MDRLERKLRTAADMVPAPTVDGPGTAVGVLAYGTTHHAIVESRHQLRDEQGLETDYLRLRAFPFSDDVRSWIEAHDRVYVVEQNRDAQMLRMLRMDFPEVRTKLRSVLHYDGLPIDARTVTDHIVVQEAGQNASGENGQA
jgi:2-oxoglutarate ferredoxin oxidoreductase subunit alpha